MDGFMTGGKAFLLVVSAMILFRGVDAEAMQPCEAPSFQAVAQGPAQCGPTCVYMVFSHLKAHRRFQECDLREHPEKKAEFGHKITGETAICRWVNGGRGMGGTPWGMMKRAIDGLHVPGAAEPFFTSELVDAVTAHGGRPAEAERERRLDYLKEAFLDRNRPVIIHLKRRWLQPGHYLVLTGYDPGSGTVSYADPNSGSTGTVGKESFIRDRWYRCPSNPAAYYRARWDGTWLGFSIRPDVKGGVSPPP